MIQHLEEFSLNAWPALQTLLYQGWVLRFANGYTRRSNSISPLYASAEEPADGDLQARLRFCEELYIRNNFKSTFKMTAAVQPYGLDEFLARAGYMVDAQTSVQLCDLGGLERPLHPAVQSEMLTAKWLAEFCRFGQVNDRNRSTLAQMLEGGLVKRCFALLQDGNTAVACGLGVLQEPYVALFDIVVDPACRRRGLGKQIVLNLLDWGKRNGAETGFLQVMLNNPPALRLYAQLGFKEVYQYWYRVKV